MIHPDVHPYDIFHCISFQPSYKQSAKKPNKTY